MPINDPRALAVPMRGAVIAWLAAGRGRFSITSGVRTRQEQIDLRITNGCPDIWSSPSSSCRIATAIPGTSKHERGEAVDIGGDRSLAARLAPQFGLGRTVPSESWHFEVVNSAIASRYPSAGGFTMADIDRIINKLDEVIASNQNQGELTRQKIEAQGNLSRISNRRQALLTRHEVLKSAHADQRDLDAILAELAKLGPEEIEGRDGIA